MESSLFSDLRPLVHSNASKFWPMKILHTSMGNFFGKLDLQRVKLPDNGKIWGTFYGILLQSLKSIISKTQASY